LIWVKRYRRRATAWSLEFNFVISGRFKKSFKTTGSDVSIKIFLGFLNAVYFMPLLLTNSNRKNINEIEMNTLIPKIKDILSILLTFFLTVIAWVFFRSNTILDAVNFQ
jgi:hypothetical protein